jgi:menaquinone-dependent protoporphyrinogen IX oxidase
MQQSRNQLDRELAQYPWLKPAALEVFIGKYDPAKFGFVERLLYGSSIKDHRDWDAIRAWANALPAHLAQG